MDLNLKHKSNHIPLWQKNSSLPVLLVAGLKHRGNPLSCVRWETVAEGQRTHISNITTGLSGMARSITQCVAASSPFQSSYCRPQEWRLSGTGGRPGSWRKTVDRQTSSTSHPAAGSEAPSGASRDGSVRKQMFEYRIMTAAALTGFMMTYGNVTAVDQYLQDWVVFGWIQRGQVIQGAVDGPVNPFSEFTGQMFCVTLLEFPSQDVWKKLETNEKKPRRFRVIHQGRSA